MKQHFVTFYSPGTLFAEQTSEPIASWDTQEAMRMARHIKERHGATPYGFAFSTRERNDSELDSRETTRSGMYFLGGKIETLEDVKARNSPDEHILRANMECNGWNRIITNTNSWKITQPLRENDVVLEWNP
jgi:hypothetical protein